MSERRARGTGRLYRRGRIWWIRYSVDGKRINQSAHSTKRTDAVRLLNTKLGEVAQGRWVNPRSDHLTFEDLAEMLRQHFAHKRSQVRASGALKHLRRHFGMHRVRAITADRLTAYRNERFEEGAAPATVKYELAVLRKGFSLAIRAEHIAWRPAFPEVTVENIRTGFFEPDEFQALLAELPPMLKGVVEFEYHTGWRKDEVYTRQWRNVDFDAGVIRLEPGETKNGKGRTFPFDALPRLKAVLEAQRRYTDAVERRTGQVVRWVFHREGRPIRDMYAAWRSACKRAGIGRKIPHDFRRTAVRNLERAGVPRSVAMQLVGHETEAIYRRYAITNEADLREGVAKLAAQQNSARARGRTIVPFDKGTVRGQSERQLARTGS